ncbi:MAG: LPS assembly protein LptD [Lysobacteraceae bacterium]
MRQHLRLLPLPLCIAMSLSAQAADDRPEDWALCPVEDAVPAFADLPASQAPAGKATDRTQQNTEIGGDSLEGSIGQVLNYNGNVLLHRGDQVLATDHLSYDEDKETYEAEGSVRYQDSGMRLVAARARGDQSKDTHELEDIRYQLVARRGNGGAKRVEMNGDIGSLYGSTYSTCPPDDRRWELRAQRIDVDTAAGLGTAHNATLRVGKVPVLYLPWFRFPIDDRRRTGLLYPSVSQSSRNGFDWRQPIYLNLAPNYDATLNPRFMSKRGLQLGGEFRFLTPTSRGVFDAAFLPSDDLTDRERDQEIAEGVPVGNRRAKDRGFARFAGSQDFGPHWQARANLGWISDTRYLDDASNNINGGANSFVLSDIGLYGRGHDWEATIMADHWQLADFTLTDANLPYTRLPRAQVRWQKRVLPMLETGVDAEAVRFDHPEFAGGSRIDVHPYVSLPLEGASWYVKPTLGWRYTGYALEKDRALPGRDDNPTRSLPIATLDAGLFFDRHMRFRGDDYLHTLEPRIFYFNAPYRDQSGIPLFDTRPLTFGWGQLFRDNRYSGADRQADGNQLTLAVSTRLIRESDGHEKLSASLGQIRYFEDARVTVPGEQSVEQGKSAWVVDVNYAPNDRWTIGASYQWDPKSGRRDLASLRTRYLIGDDGIVNLSYRYRRDLLEQADLSFLYPINPSWSLVGRYYYSIKDSQLLEGIAGVQWESCCIAVRLVDRRYLRHRGEQLDNAIQLEIELKGLGSAGPDTEGRLRRAILGYYREDLSLVPPPQTRGGELPSSASIP